MKKFEDYLNKQRGKIREIEFFDRFQMQKEISTYYWNRASDLNSGTLVIWHTYDSPETAVDPKSLGLGEGFSFRFSLHPVFSLLAGLSIELLLKAIARIIDQPHLNSHDLNKLAKHIGINLSKDHQVILSVLSDDIIWSARYPAPKKREEWENALNLRSKQWKKSGGSMFERMIPGRQINLKNYKEIWRILSQTYWQAKNEIHEP